MRKIYCDICGREIRRPEDRSYCFHVYTNTYVESFAMNYNDVCGNCYDKVKYLIDGMKERSKRNEQHE